MQEEGKKMDSSPLTIETAIDAGYVSGLTVHDQDGHADEEVNGEICVHGVNGCTRLSF